MRRVGEGFPLKRAIPILALPMILFSALIGKAEAQASRPNVKFFYKAGKVVRQEMDKDRDGRTDVWFIYEQGQLVRQEEDTDGNGLADVWYHYEGNRLKKQEKDNNGDGKPDAWYYLN